MAPRPHEPNLQPNAIRFITPAALARVPEAGPSLGQRLLPVIAAVAEQFRLPGLRFERQINLPGGRVAVKVSDAAGQSYLLQRLDPGYQPAEHLRRQRFVLHLCRQGLPVPNLIAMPDGATVLVAGGAAYELQAWVEGISFSYSDPNEVASAGYTLGRLHRIAAGYEGEVCQRPAEREWLMLTRQRLNDLSRRVDAISDPRSRRIADAALDALTDSYSAADHTISSFLPQLPRLHVHGNYHGGNLVFNRRGEVIAVRGWDEAHYASRLLELAQSLIYFSALGGGEIGPDIRRDHQPDEELLYIFLSAYQSEIELTVVETSLLAVALQVAWPFVLGETLLQGFYYPEASDGLPPNGSTIATTLAAAVKLNDFLRQV